MSMTLWRRYLLAIISGLIAVCAFPPIGWWPLVLAAAAVFLFALRGAGCRHGFYLGLVHGLVFYGVSLSWFWDLFQHFAIQLWLILALFHALAGLIAGGVSRRNAGTPWLAAYAALAWAAIEYFRAEWFWLRFPWMTHGLGLGPTWLSPWIGVYGAGFLVMLAACLVVFGGRTQRRIGIAAAMALLALGIFRPPPVAAGGEGVPVLAVQSENCDFETYLHMSAERPFSNGIILWPEYAAPSGLRRYPADLEKAMTLAADKNSTLVLGTVAAIDETDHHNEAVTLDATGIVGSHYKARPVPFMGDGVAGDRAEPVATRFGLIGTPICFDCDYVEIVRRMTAAGAEAFAVPSMDAVHWSRRQHLQHAEIFKHRALENGRWIAVCATSGRTQIIDPHGNRVAEIPLMEEGLLEGRIHLRDEKTFFTRYGWLFPWMICGMFVTGSGILAGAWVKQRTGRGEASG